MSNDLQLQRRVIEELEFEPNIDAAHIGVSARDGVVTLTSHAASFFEKLTAEHAARRVKGVKAVAQNIEIEFPSDSKTSDDEIANRVLKILKWHRSVPIDRIAVKVEHGIVTLTGEVDWYVQKTKAEADARRLGGVREVLNEIKVALGLRAEDIRQQINAAMDRHAGIEPESVVVLVSDGKATLSGKVKTEAERETCERIAWSPKGVSEVENRIQLAHRIH